ncbi:hypothetical protein BGZ58_000329 [Dissophora ornata]|nr:hypothetical protein BGZ58_000329 [Dissophora ornata]
MDRIVGHGNPQSGTGSELDHCDRRRIDSSVGDSAASSSSSSSSVSYSPVMGSPIITCLAAAPGGDKIGGSGLTAKSNNGDRGSNLNLNIENNSNSRGGTKDQGQDQDCAICLDVIMPRKHAKAILACRHEFHLSCISMAFAMGKEMVCPLCRYLHEDQPFMSLEAEDGVKPTTASFPTRRSPHHHTTAYHPHPSSSSTASTHHEHPTGGTVLSMMPSLFETSLGHGPAAGTIRTSPDGICLKTSTWLMLYAFPFSIALCFLAFVLGKVETMWSKVSCLIGAAICYMVCWGLVVAVMDPDHEARALLEMLNQMQESEAAAALRSGRTVNSPANFASPSTSSVATLVGSDSTTPSASTSSLEAVALSWSAWWVQQRYAQGIRNRMTDLAGMLDDLPDMMGEW